MPQRAAGLHVQGAASQPISRCAAEGISTVGFTEKIELVRALEAEMRALSILRAGFGAFEHGTDATVNCRVDENCWAVRGQGEVQPDASLADAKDHLEAHKGVLREQILTLLALQGRLGQLEVPEHIDLRVPNNFQETHL